MAAKKKSGSSLKIKKKRWVPVVAPKLFRNFVIGESHVLDPENLKGRQVKVSLMTLTNDIKKQNVYINLKVTDIKNANAQTTIVGYSMIPAATKRIVRRNRDKLDDSFICETSNNVFVRIKPLIITRNKAKGSATTNLIKKNREKLAAYMKRNTFENFVSDVISSKLQRSMKEQLSKVFPVRIYEMRAFKIESGKIKPNSIVKAIEEKNAKKSVKKTPIKKETEKVKEKNSKE